MEPKSLFLALDPETHKVFEIKEVAQLEDIAIESSQKRDSELINKLEEENKLLRNALIKLEETSTTIIEKYKNALAKERNERFKIEKDLKEMIETLHNQIKQINENQRVNQQEENDPNKVVIIPDERQNKADVIINVIKPEEVQEQVLEGKPEGNNALVNEVIAKPEGEVVVEKPKEGHDPVNALIAKPNDQEQEKTNELAIKLAAAEEIIRELEEFVDNHPKLDHNAKSICEEYQHIKFNITPNNLSKVGDKMIFIKALPFDCLISINKYDAEIPIYYIAGYEEKDDLKGFLVYLCEIREVMMEIVENDILRSELKIPNQAKAFLVTLDKLIPSNITILHMNSLKN